MKTIHDGLIVAFRDTAYGDRITLRPSEVGNFELLLDYHRTTLTWEEAEKIGREMNKLAKKMKQLANVAAEQAKATGEFIEDEKE